MTVYAAPKGRLRAAHDNRKVRLAHIAKPGLAVCLLSLLIASAHAQQITDPRAPIQFRPSLGVSANGTPTVNITAPSLGGISHNKFERYDVDTRGVILNNSNYSGTSVIGGAVSANPNLIGQRPAAIILNEVTGTRSSTLNGPTEVFGTRADVIVANPNGVGCVGCSFINAGRITLTTGVPQPDYITGTMRYSVTGGTVSVSGGGLSGGNGETLGKIDLIGRQLRIEGPIASQGAVRLRAGAINYDQSADTSTPLTGVSALSGTAISSTADGVIRAGTLSVLSRDIDLGVDLRGNLLVQGETFIRSFGNASVSGSASGTDLTVTADGAVMLNGRHEALGRITVQGSSVEFALGSTLIANDAIVAQALQSLVARGILQSGQDIALTANGALVASGSISSAGSVILEGQSVYGQNLALAGRHVAVAGVTSVQLDKSGLLSLSDVAITAQDISLGQGTAFEAANRLIIDARNSLTVKTVLDYPNLDLTVRNRLEVTETGSIVQDVLLLNVRDEIVNAGILYGVTSTSLSTSNLTNTSTGLVYGPDVSVVLQGALTNLGRILSTRSLSILTAGRTQNDGIIQTDGSLLLRSAAYSSTATTSVLAGLSAQLITTGAFETAGTVLGAQGLTLQAALLRNSGTLSSGTFAALGVTGDIDNSGTILAADSLAIVAGGSIRTPGHILAQNGDLTLQAGGSITSGGTIIAAGRVLLSASTDYQSTSTLTKLGGTSIELNLGGAFLNLGYVSALEDLSITASSLENGALVAGSNAGIILARDIDLAISGATRNQGNILAERAFTLLSTASITNSGKLSGNLGASITTSGQLINSGLLAFNGTLTLSSGAYTGSATSAVNAGAILMNVAGTLDNAGSILSKQALTLNAATLVNTGSGQLNAVDMSLTLSGDVTNSGSIIAQNSLSLAARNLTNATSLSTITGGALIVTLSGNGANDGSIQSASDISLSSGGYFTNGGLIVAAGSANLKMGGAYTNSGRTLANDDLVIKAAGLAGYAGSKLSATDIDLTITGQTTLAGETLATSSIRLKSGALANIGLIKSANILADVSGAFSNSGTILASNDLVLNIAGSTTNSGLLQASGVLTLTGSSIWNAPGGRIEADELGLTSTGTITNNAILTANLAVLNAGALTNQGNPWAPAYISADRLSVTVSGLLYNSSYALLQGLTTARVQAGSVNAGFLTNPDIASGRFNFTNNLDLTLTGSGYTFDSPLIVPGNLSFTAAGSIINNSTVAAGGALSLISTGGHIDNNQNAVLFSLGDMRLQAAGNITNTAAYIESGGNLTIIAGGGFYNKGIASNLIEETSTVANAVNYEIILISPARWINKEGVFYNYTQDMFYEQYFEAVYKHIYKIYFGSNATVSKSYVNSGKNIILNSVIFNNEYSIFSANENIYINASGFDNKSYNNQNLVFTITSDRYPWRFYNLGPDVFYLTGDGGFCAWGIIGGRCVPIYDESWRRVEREVLPGGDLSANITAGGIFSANVSSSFTNTGTIEANTAIIRAPTVTIGITNPNIITPVARLPKPVIDLSDYLSVSGGLTQFASSSVNAVALAVPGSSTAITPVTTSAPPGSAKVTVSYLNKAPLQAQGVREPSWILEQVGDSRGGLTFFADPTVERRLLQQAVIDQTGRSLLDPAYKNATKQQEQLYQGTVDFLKSNPTIRLGDALSEAQRAAITAPILWYENRAINGQNVLVPQLLLPPGDLEKYTTQAGGLVSAENISIIGDNVTNTGTILATQDLTIRATEFTNERRVMQTLGNMYRSIQSGGVLAAENIDIRVDGDLINRGGTISATGDVNLVSISGDIINEAARGHSLQQLSRKVTSLKPEIAAGQIVAGGDLTIVARDGSFRNVASNLGAMGDIVVSASDGISVESIAETYMSQYSKSGGLFSKKTSYTITPLVFSSSIRSVAGDVVFDTDGDLKIAGGSIEATYGSVEANARNILIETVSAEGLHYAKGMKIGFTGASGFKTAYNDFAVSQPMIAAGTDIRLTASGDFAARGALLAAGEDIAVTAGGNLTFDANQNQRFYTSKSWSVGLTYPGSNIISAIENGGGAAGVLSAAISQDPLGAALVSLAKGGGGMAALRTAVAAVDLGGAVGKAYNLNPQTGGATGALNYLTNRLDSLNPVSQWGSVLNPDSKGLGSAAFGISFSRSKTQSLWSESQISSLSAGGNIALKAGLSGAGDLSLLDGTQVAAARDVTLSGSNIIIEALKDWNYSSSKSFGGGITFSSSGISIGGHYSQRKSNGEDFTNAAVFAGGDLKITTPGDLTVHGGSLNGGTVHADIGGNLDLVSLQDWQKTRGFSISGSILITPGGVPLPQSLGLGFVNGDKAWSSVSEIVGLGDTVIKVGGNVNLVGATIASATDKLDLSAASLTWSNLEDRDSLTDASINISFPTGWMQGQTSISSIMGGISGAYENRDKQGVTYAVVGNGKVVIGGDSNPVVLGEIKRDIAGRQVVTVDDQTGFSFDIPLINFSQLAENAASTINLLTALTTPVPENVAAQGPVAADYFRRIVAGGATPEMAAALTKTPEFAKLVEEAEQLNLKAQAGEKITPLMELAISAGFAKLVQDQTGVVQAVIVGCDATSAPGDCTVQLDKLQDYLKKNPQVANLFQAQVNGKLNQYLDQNPILAGAGIAEQAYANKLFRDLVTCTITSQDPGALIALQNARPDEFNRLLKTNAVYDSAWIKTALSEYQRDRNANAYSASILSAKDQNNQDFVKNLAKIGFDLTPVGAVYNMSVAAKDGDPVGVLVAGIGFVPMGKIAGWLGKGVGEVKAILSAGGSYADDIAAQAYQKAAAGELFSDGTRLLSKQGGTADDLFGALNGVNPQLLSNDAAGKIGEEIAKKQLLKSGEFVEVASLQNASGHGVDIIAKKADGSYVFFEVKAGKDGFGTELSAQQQNMQKFVETRLNRAAEAGPWWGNTPDATKNLANEALDWLSKNNQINGQVISINLTEQAIKVKPWN